MFMVKDEFKNTWDLLKVRHKPNARLVMWFFIIVAIILLTAIVGILSAFSGSTRAINSYTVTDASNTFFFGILFGFIIGSFMYKNSNLKISVFPQTNNSRLISWLLYNYMTATVVGVVVLISYLIQLAVITLMAASDSAVILGLNVDAGFITAGLFAYIAYSFLIVASIELIAAIIRKWTYYAIIAFTALISLAISNLAKVIEYIPEVLAFLIFEPSLLQFFLKAAGLWVAITAVTLVINRFTVFHKSQNTAMRKGVVIACIVIAVLIIIVFPLIFMVAGDSESTFSLSPYDDWVVAPENEIRLDVSQIPDISKINVEGINIIIPDESGFTMWNSTDPKAIIGNLDELEGHGNTLVLQYRNSLHMVNGIDILDLANPQIHAYIDGDTLIVNYTYDDINVIIMPIWSIIRQFDIFKDRNLMTAHALGMSSGMSGDIWINFTLE